MDAKDIVRLLDGMTIDAAKRTLEHAMTLLTTTQVVSRDAPLLIERDVPMEEGTETATSSSSAQA